VLGIGKVQSCLQGCHMGSQGQEVVVPVYEVLCWAGDERTVRFVPAVRSGQVPKGCVPLGSDADGKPIYGARASHLGALHPGQARANLDSCSIGCNGREVRLPEYELLCFGAGPGRLAGDDVPRQVQAPHSDSASSSDSGGSESDGDDEVQGTLLSLGVPLPLPSFCKANEAVEKAPRELPAAVLDRLPGKVTSMKKLSDGWHEGYELKISSAAQATRVFCRIWRAQLGYHRLESAIGAGVELKAMEIARAAGLPTPELLWDVSGKGVFGLCERGDAGLTEFAVFQFVDGADSERKVARDISKRQPLWRFSLELMSRLHSHPVGLPEATKPLARFENWHEQLAYLECLAPSGGADLAAEAVASVRRLFESSNVPSLPPALGHLDWHFGNVLVSQGDLLAVIDWEFAGIADPRFDLARFLRLECFTGDGSRCSRRKGAPKEQEIWEAYSQIRFGRSAQICLGPWEPWVALESLAVLTLTSAICARLAAGCTAGVPADSENYVPRCDLGEWVEDMQTAVYQLRRLGLLS